MMQFQTLTLYGRSVQHGAEVEKWIWKNWLWSFCDGRKVTRPMPGCLISVLPKIWWTTYGLSPTSPMSHRPPPMRSLVISASLVLHSSVMGQIICFEFCSWMKRNHSVWRFSCLRKLIKHIIHVVHNTQMCFVKFAMFQSDWVSLSVVCSWSPWTRHTSLCDRHVVQWLRAESLFRVPPTQRWRPIAPVRKRVRRRGVTQPSAVTRCAV